MAHRFGLSADGWCSECGHGPEHQIHDLSRWEVRRLPWKEKRPWFSLKRGEHVTFHETWNEAVARVCEDLREKQG